MIELFLEAEEKFGRINWASTKWNLIGRIFGSNWKNFVDQLNISFHKIAVLLLFYVTRPISTARGHFSADRFHNTKHKHKFPHFS